MNQYKFLTFSNRQIDLLRIIIEISGMRIDHFTSALFFIQQIVDYLLNITSLFAVENIGMTQKSCFPYFWQIK